jgi:hypothetical protein
MLRSPNWTLHAAPLDLPSQAAKACGGGCGGPSPAALACWLKQPKMHKVAAKRKCVWIIGVLRS